MSCIGVAENAARGRLGVVSRTDGFWDTPWMARYSRRAAAGSRLRAVVLAPAGAPHGPRTHPELGTQQGWIQLQAEIGVSAIKYHLRVANIKKIVFMLSVTPLERCVPCTPKLASRMGRVATTV